MAFSKKRETELLIEKGLMHIWEELRNAGCPYTEYIDFKYFGEKILEESTLRYNILEWILLSICPRFESMFEKKKSLEEQSKMIHRAASSLGLCTVTDCSLIKGYTTKRKQINFFSFLFKMIPNKNAKHLAGLKYDFDCSGESLVADTRRSNVIGELLSIKGIMTEDVPRLQLFPPEIMALLEKEKSCMDSSLGMNSSMLELENEISRLENEIDKQYDVLQQLKKDVFDFNEEQSLQATGNLSALTEKIDTTMKPLIKMANGIRDWFKASVESSSKIGPLALELDTKLAEVILFFQHLNSFQSTYAELKQIYQRFERKVLLADSNKKKGHLLNTMLQEWIEIINASIARLEQSKEK